MNIQMDKVDGSDIVFENYNSNIENSTSDTGVDVYHPHTTVYPSDQYDTNVFDNVLDVLICNMTDPAIDAMGSEDNSKSFKSSTEVVEKNAHSTARKCSSDLRVADSIPLTPSFIQAVFNLMTYTEFDNLNDLIERSAKFNYDFQLCKSNTFETFTGNGVFARITKSVYSTCPDLIMSSPVVKYHGTGKSYRVIETSYSNHFTYLVGDGMHLRGFRDDKYRESYSILNDVDKNTSPKTLKKFKKIIDEAKASTKLISVKGRGSLHFYVDEFSNRIGKIRTSVIFTEISKYTRPSS